MHVYCGKVTAAGNGSAAVQLWWRGTRTPVLWAVPPLPSHPGHGWLRRRCMDRIRSRLVIADSDTVNMLTPSRLLVKDLRVLPR